jgi:DNA repair protein SbcC/Rad50
MAAAIRSIIDDRDICRKFVINVNGKGLRESLYDLPFWPPAEDMISGSATIATGVGRILAGFNSELISDLTRYSPGADRIFEKIGEGKYSLTVEDSTPTTNLEYRANNAERKNRVKGIEINGFRGIRHLSYEQMPLDANIVMIYGPNGVGKTSIADAIEWAITGEVQHLSVFCQGTRVKPDPLVNLLGQTLEASVTCHFSEIEKISRHKMGIKITRQISDKVVGEDRDIIDHVVRTSVPKEAQLQINRLRELFRSSHMLSQHDIRHFLEEANPANRFDILTNMIGAEEFVRFRKKSSAVANSVKSQLRKVDLDLEDLDSKSKELSKRVSLKQTDFDECRKKLTEGVEISIIIEQLKDGLARNACTVDDRLFQDCISSPTSTTCSIAANESKRAIRDRLSEVEDLQRKLNAVSNQRETYQEAILKISSLNSLVKSLTQEKAELEVYLSQKQKVLDETNSHLQQEILKKNQLKREFERISWTSRNTAKYHEIKASSQALHIKIEENKKTINSLEEEIGKVRDAGAQLSAKITRITAEVENKTLSKNTLEALILRCEKIVCKLDNSEELKKTNSDIESKISSMKNITQEIRLFLSKKESLLEDLRQKYRDETTKHDEVKSLLAKISQYISSPECPLCGKTFASVDEARGAISLRLGEISPLLKRFSEEIEIVEKQVQELRSQLKGLISEIDTLQATMVDNSEMIKVSNEDTSSFLIESSQLGISLSQSEPKIWKAMLENAKSRFGIEAIVGERQEIIKKYDATQTSASEIEGQLVKKKDALILEEMSVSRLLDEIEDFEATMREYSINPASLPTSDQIAGKSERMQDQLEKLETKEKDMADSVRSLSNEFEIGKQRLQAIEQELTNKQSQIPFQKNVSNEFEQRCKTLNLKLESLQESISLQKHELSTLLIALSELKPKANSLDQVGLLVGLEKEIAGLKDEHQKINLQLTEERKTQERLSNWKVLFNELDDKVSSGQVDVVTSHLKQLEPTTQRLYQRLNPHPLFGNVTLNVDENSKVLDVYAKATVPLFHQTDLTISPPAFFSDAQLNSLALTVFLGGALRQRWSNFGTVVIDDPIQQMDELNVYSFIDLLRGLSFCRQFIILTCNQDFYLLAMEKLECLNKERPGSFLAHRLSGVAPAELEIHNDVH